jgi:hypothetical protein
MKFVIPGGSGQVGHILARYFHARGHAVTARGWLGWPHCRRLDCRSRAERRVHQPGGTERRLPVHGSEPARHL